MLKFEIVNTVAYVTLNRPEIHNAFNDELIEKITSVFSEIENTNVRLVVLSGEGRSFCAGADLNWMKSMIGYTEEENFQDSMKLASMFEAINNCSVPVIGKVNGHALGGGVGVVSVCDYVISHEKAKFGFTEARLGLIPAVISPYCIKKIGESSARAWFMSGELFSAKKALSMNLIHEVTPLDSFEERCEQLIESFFKAGPEAAKDSKKLIKKVLDLNVNEVKEFTCKAIAQKRISEEGQEGMSALLEKRTAKWVKND